MKKRQSLISLFKRYLKGFQDVNIVVENVIAAPSELLKGKTAVITGASRGIGFAIAQQYINAGAHVIGVAKSEENLKNAAAILGNNFHYLVCDLSNEAMLMSCISSALKIESHIDILVNAAGIKNGQDERFWDFSTDEFNYAMNVNARAPFFLSRDVIKHFLSRKTKGYIVNIIGIKGSIGEGSPYSISKFGLNGMTKGMARRFAPENIIINGISPGAAMTDANRSATNGNMYHLDTPNGRMADPQEIANIALFLVSGMADNMIGSIVNCDGGEMLQYLNNRY